MFKNPEALSPEKHISLKLSGAPDYRFAANEIVCPIVSGEIWQVARDYIIVFPTHPQGLPLALLGTQVGMNAYIGDTKNLWKARYIPAHLRRYPFIAAPISTPADEVNDQQRYTVCIEPNAPQLSESVGQPLFNADGSGTELLKTVQNALITLHYDFNITQTLVKQINEAGLLINQTLTFKPLNREPFAIEGFCIVDQQKLRNAEPDLIASLIKSRALDLIYAHIGSLSNIHDGLLARQVNEPTANKQQELKADVEGLFTSIDDDMIKFNF